MTSETRTRKRHDKSERKSNDAKRTQVDEVVSKDGDGKEVVNTSTKKTWLRCVLSQIKYLVLILFLPPFINYVALLRESALLQPPGALYDVGFGQKMFMSCNGSGSPTVILDAGIGSTSDQWHAIVQAVQQFTKACVYDRAGLGFSSRPIENSSSADNGSPQADGRHHHWQPYTVEKMVDELRTLVTFSSQQPRPFLFVSAEIASLTARFYTQVYESDVVGMLLVNPLPEDLFSYDDHVWSYHWWRHLVPESQARQLYAALGYTRLCLLLGFDDSVLPSAASTSADVVNRHKHLMCNPRHLSSVVDEYFFINETFSQMQTVFRMKSFPENTSVIVISSSEFNSQMSPTLNQAWLKAQKNFVTTLHPNAKHIVPENSDRTSLYVEQSRVIIDEIRQFVKQYRAAAVSR